MILPRFFIHFLIFVITFCFDTEASPRVGLITSSTYVGDREVAWRIKIGGERLGWEVFLDEQKGQLLKQQKFDWVICMLPKNSIKTPHYPNYLMVFHPFWYLDKQGKFDPFYEKYDGYLLTINDRETLENGLKEKNKKFFHIPFYPTTYNTPYRRLEPKHLVVMIPVWGDRLKQQRFLTLYKLLSETGLVKFYGVKPHKDIITQGYMGSLPFDGVSVIDTLQQHGIVLVSHSPIHNEASIPSARIFEAAAASAIIICDENPFVKKHFGDSVFYFDTSLSGTSMFEQIQECLHKIYQNPEKALEMAKAAHDIFIEKFTMEEQLLKLLEMHERVMEHNKLQPPN